MLNWFKKRPEQDVTPKTIISSEYLGQTNLNDVNYLGQTDLNGSNVNDALVTPEEHAEYMSKANKQAEWYNFELPDLPRLPSHREIDTYQRFRLLDDLDKYIKTLTEYRDAIANRGDAVTKYVPDDDEPGYRSIELFVNNSSDGERDYYFLASSNWLTYDKSTVYDTPHQAIEAGIEGIKAEMADWINQLGKYDEFKKKLNGEINDEDPPSN